MTPAQRSAFARVSPLMSPGDRIAVRQMITYLGYDLDRALRAVRRADLIEQQDAGVIPLPARARSAGAVAQRGDRALSHGAPVPPKIPGAAGAPRNLPVGPGAQGDPAPPFWLARLRGVAPGPTDRVSDFAFLVGQGHVPQAARVAVSGRGRE